MSLTGLKQHNALTSDFLAAIREPRDPDNPRLLDTWKLTRDPAEVTKHHDEDVVFARDAMELVAQLEKRNPAPAGFSYVQPAQSLEKATKVETCMHMFATTATMDQIYKAARKFGSIMVDAKKVGASQRGNEHYGIVDDEFYYDFDIDALVHDPKKVKRIAGRRKAVETQKARYGMMNLDVLCNMTYVIAEFLSKTFTHLCNHWHNWEYGVYRYEGPSSRSGRSYVCRDLKNTILLARELRAIKRLRKHKPYREWLYKLRPCISGMKNNGDMDSLGRVLEEECKAMRLKVPTVAEVLKRKSAAASAK